MNQARHVVVIDDEQELCELLAMRLEHHGYRVTTSATGKGGLALLGGDPVDAMILDLRLGDSDGLDVLSEVHKRAPDVPVVILTAHGTIQTAVEAMQRGAYGFLTKPFHDHDLLQKLGNAVERSTLRREVAGLRRIVGGEDVESRLLGTSAAIARVRELIARIAPSDATVLSEGESGTGKELCARMLHELSLRKAGPFVAVNCGALPSELLESELFGHVRGAFTGAIRDKAGLFAAARGGTLFLDEIGESSIAVQVKLLRVLQERRYARVGSTQEEEADVRVLAATNRELRALVADGQFREDLFYRLHVVPLRVPPLRERDSDVRFLATLFLERSAARHGMPVPRLSRDAMDALLSHPWPGNVRELANVMEAALLMSRSNEIHAKDLSLPTGALTSASTSTSVAAPGNGPPSGLHAVAPRASGYQHDAQLGAMIVTLSEDSAPLPPLREARDAFEKAYIIESLKRSGGNVAAAARVAGRNRTDFYELLRRHGLSPASFKESLPGYPDHLRQRTRARPGPRPWA
jgi:DNA-binding NtrC family response regulator